MLAALEAEAELVDRRIQADAEVDLGVLFLVGGRLDTMLPPQPVFQSGLSGLPEAPAQPPSIWKDEGLRNGLLPLKVRLGSPLMS